MVPEQLLIVFMIVLLGVVLVHVLSNILTAAKDLETKKGPCKIHNWYEMVGPDQETVITLYCIDCNKTPKMIQEELE